MRTFTARWVFPVAGPPLERGTVTIRGDVIESVDPHGVRTPDEDLGNVAILPGLVNPHTHLDLSGARGLIPPTDPEHFTDWLRGVIAYRRSRSAEQVQADIRVGLAECMRNGTTLIGDIASAGASWDEVSNAKLRAVVFWELIGLDPNRFNASWETSGFTSGLSWEEPTQGIVVRPNTPLCKWAVSPHAPYTVNNDCMRLTLYLSTRLATHVAETAIERDLLEKRSGPFVEFLKDMNAYEENSLATSWDMFLTPFKEPQRVGTWILVHANYLSRCFAFRPEHSIVYCPRTHAAFRHPTHPFREFLQRGVHVCLGTDSLASNPDLDILAEARFVHAKYPDFPGDTLLKMITLSGAEALGWANETGSLEPGKSADFVCVPLPDRDAADPHALLFAEHPGERRTMFRGEWRA